MDRKQAIEILIELKESDDCEVVHSEADCVLCELLEALGYNDVVEAYDEVCKWYA